MAAKFRGIPPKGPVSNPPLQQLQIKFQQAVALHQAGRLAEAQAFYRDILKVHPKHFDCLHLSGVAAIQSGQQELGIKLINKAIAVNPGIAAAYNNRGGAFLDLKRFDEALASYDKAVSLKPDYADAYNNRGNALLGLHRLEEALASFDKALSLRPDFADAHYNRGQPLMELRRLEEALASYDKTLSLRPDDAVAHNNRGNVLQKLQQWDEALASYDKALSLDPYYADAYNNRGSVFLDLDQPKQALAHFDKALSLMPDHVEALNHRGYALTELKRPDEAQASFEKALSLKPDFDFLFGDYLDSKMNVCNWDSLTENLRRYERDIAASKRVTAPFSAFSLIDSPELHKKAAEVYAEARHPKSNFLGPINKRSFDGKIRLGYYSADFRDHPVTHLISELFEEHDRTKFELCGFYFGPDKRDDKFHMRVRSAFDKFFDVRGKSDREIVQLSRELGIDIAVDLMGYTTDSRTGIFAEGCAPIQVSYLGHPGTMGASYIDYVIADKTLIPEERRADFTEKPVYMPHSYQVNDSKLEISERVFTREELGLPETGFVFCCFNNNRKILPATFDGWMRILKSVEGSVLWLFAGNPTAEKNLRKEAERRGVDSGRLVFAQRMPLDEHLARHRVANLFLDTLPYNAHTTTSIALWTGLPVLTCMGRSFPSRVAASVLKAIDLPELVTTSQDEYENKAIELATNAVALRELKERLEKNRMTTPLFKGKIFAGHMEAAYEAMFERYQAGLPPAAIEVPA